MTFHTPHSIIHLLTTKDIIENKLWSPDMLLPYSAEVLRDEPIRLNLLGSSPDVDE